MKITKMNNPKKITEASGRGTAGDLGAVLQLFHLILNWYFQSVML